MKDFKRTVTSNSYEDTSCMPSDAANKIIDAIFHKDCQRVTTKPVVILIESNEELRIDLRNNLSDTYSLISFKDAFEALSFIKTRLVDLVICGTEMQGMSSEEFSSRIKTSNDTTITPVILLSSPTDDSNHLHKRIASLADIFIHFPFSMEHLKAEMAILIGNHRRLKEEFLTKMFGKNFLKKESPMIDRHTYEEFVKKAIDFILQKWNNEERITIKDIAQEMGMCRTKFATKWKEVTGEPPLVLISNLQMERAKELLMTGNRSVSEVQAKVGIKNYKHFREKFKKHFGMAPQEVIPKRR